MSRLPGPYTTLAREVTGEITGVTDCSWQRDSSAVWRLTSASGVCWYLKRHSSGRFHDREVAALQGWARAPGPGRVPELAAADPELLVMVVTAVPGQPVLGSRPGLTGTTTGSGKPGCSTSTATIPPSWSAPASASAGAQLR